MSLSQEPCANSQLGLWKSTNGNGNINTAKLEDEIGHWIRGRGSYLYIHLYYSSVGWNIRKDLSLKYHIWLYKPFIKM